MPDPERCELDSERWQRVAVLYDSAVEREPSDRARFLAAQTEGDEDLRREVESLLAHDNVPVLIDQPMLESAAAVFEEFDLKAGTLLGPYRIDTLLGAGGMGRGLSCDRYPPRSHGRHQGAAARARNRPAVPRALRARSARRSPGLTHPHICTLTTSAARMASTSW